MRRKYISQLYVIVMRQYLDMKNNISLVTALINNQKIVKSHYARVNNFGDLFNKDLVKYFGARLIYVQDYKKSQISLTGSILGAYLRDYSGVIAGSGFIRERYNRKGNKWNIKIIRGPLSAKQCINENSNQNFIYGDPRILASKIYISTEVKKYKLGIIPHSKDYDQVKNLSFPKDVKIIHPRRASQKVIKEIKQCKNIASSSLHGLIFADSLRIPNIHIKFSDKLEGGNHKFKDYYEGMETQHEFICYNSQTDLSSILNKCRLCYSDEYLENKQNQVHEILEKLIRTEI